MRAAVRWTAAIAVALGAGACGDDPVGTPVPGTLNVVLDGATGRVGAVLFRVEGGVVDTVIGEAGRGFLDAAPSGTGAEVLVAGEGLTGVIARVRVPDIRVRYRIHLEQVAHNTTFALLPPEGVQVFLVSAVP